jgi:hypothetical protein
MRGIDKNGLKSCFLEFAEWILVRPLWTKIFSFNGLQILTFVECNILFRL